MPQVPEGPDAAAQVQIAPVANIAVPWYPLPTDDCYRSAAYSGTAGGQVPGRPGNFSSLLSGMTLATKMIRRRSPRRSRGHSGSAGATNVQGETQQKLDVYANQAVLHCLGARESVAFLVSEENEQPVTIDRSAGGKYIVVFDPLDGSSNIDVNVSVGTIFDLATSRDARGDCRSSSRLETGSRWVRGVRLLHHLCLHGRTRRLRFTLRAKSALSYSRSPT
jgi:fructose-1,6-bisphosphatase